MGQQSDMARGKLRSGRHQCRSDRRDGALLLDIVTSRRCLDDLDAGSLIELRQLKRDYGVGPRRQSDEHYDFIVPKARLARPAVQRFRAVLEDLDTRDALTALAFKI